MRPSNSICLSLLQMLTTAYLLPYPPGRHNVTLTTGELVDHSRLDPYAPTPTPRALMLSVFEAADCETTIAVPYMPEQVAAYQGPYLQEVLNISFDLSPLFEEAMLPVCPPNHTAQYHFSSNHPILLFSPAYGIPRFYYNILASAIASHGVTVITIDHPYDANIILYPDSHTVYLNDTIWTGSNPYKDELVRAADASFIIDQLSLPSPPSPLPQHHTHHSRLQIGIAGHSLGGASAIFAAALDARIVAAINWDGTLFGSLPASGLTQPALFVCDAQTSTPEDWVAAWPLLHGRKEWVTVSGTTHQSFCDVPSLLAAAGVDASGFEGVLGNAPAGESVEGLAEEAAGWLRDAIEAMHDN